MTGIPTSSTQVPPTPSDRQPNSLLPTAALGWVAVGAAMIASAVWMVLPVVTALFGDQYPVTDTIVMPIIGLVVLLVAAIVNVAVLWVAAQRSLANILATAGTVGATLFFGLFVIGEGLGGA